MSDDTRSTWKFWALVGSGALLLVVAGFLVPALVAHGPESSYYAAMAQGLANVVAIGLLWVTLCFQARELSLQRKELIQTREAARHNAQASTTTAESVTAQLAVMRRGFRASIRPILRARCMRSSDSCLYSVQLDNSGKDIAITRAATFRHPDLGVEGSTFDRFALALRAKLDLPSFKHSTSSLPTNYVLAPGGSVMLLHTQLVNERGAVESGAAKPGSRLESQRVEWERFVRHLHGVKVVIQYDNVIEEPESPWSYELHAPTS